MLVKAAGMPLPIPGDLILLAAAGLIAWLTLTRRRSRGTGTGEAVAAWATTACPVCVALGSLAVTGPLQAIGAREETSRVQV
jgi:hypothetical protein